MSETTQEPQDKPKAEERIWRAIKTGIEWETRGTGGKSENRISGYASVFYDGTPGTEFQLTETLTERIDPAAFDRVLDSDDDVLGLFNHNPDLVLGRRSAGTMKLSKDDRGLRFDIVLPETGAGRDALESIRRGDVTGSSFSFVPRKLSRQMVGDMDIRIVQDVELFDVGPVTFPAYKATSAEVNQRDISGEIHYFQRMRAHEEIEAEKALQAAHEQYMARVAEIEQEMR